jgi:hypothetical protein
MCGESSLGNVMSCSIGPGPSSKVRRAALSVAASGGFCICRGARARQAWALRFVQLRSNRDLTLQMAVLDVSLRRMDRPSSRGRSHRA